LNILNPKHEIRNKLEFSKFECVFQIKESLEFCELIFGFACPVKQTLGNFWFDGSGSIWEKWTPAGKVVTSGEMA